MATFQSDLTRHTFPLSEKVSGKTLRQSLVKFLQKEYPDFKPEHNLALSELNGIRERYIADCLTRQIGELTDLEKRVLESITNKETLSDKVEDDARPTTLGQRVADGVATFGGSWTFIISFMFFLMCWIVFNVYWLANKGFDPYPFILLNLILSCLAALQAPVIMMSQNRQEEKDRDRAKKDYMVNLKSELEIRALHEKIDHLIMHQQQELMEVQRIQIEMMNDIMHRLKS
ncbi:MAG: DUF1003 domain-containing protein [Cyclobacteriaceae bacterium]|nr:DUF1003 domain-containing protein [Cyclobacteriaceae bacterium]